MTATLHRTNAVTTHAIALRRADHDALGRRFTGHEKTHSVADKQALVAEICAAPADDHPGSGAVRSKPLFAVAAALALGALVTHFARARR